MVKLKRGPASPKTASRGGFTLLELLIVIGLIGILLAISVTSYITIQKKSRDSRRSGDMKAIQNAFEQFNADNKGVYPKAESEITSTGYLPGGIPKDPKSVSPYVYTITYDAANGATYCACAYLEGTTTGGNATTTSCAFGPGAYYCVQNLQ